MSDMDFCAFGELLTTLRKQRHISQKDLAEKLDVHRNTIGTWERGNSLPESKTMVLELAKQLHLNEQETRQLLEASLTEVSPYWNVPYQRNPFFTGREEFLHMLHEQLNQKHKMALTQSWAISGLGGIGKTQIALEYAYQYRHDYRSVFWLSAASRETLLAGFMSIAETLAVA